MVSGRGRTGLAPGADQACGNLCRGTRDPWEFGKGLRVVPPGDVDAARCTASAGAVRIPARLFSTDAGSDRRGLDFRGRLATNYTDWRRSPGSTALRRGEMRVIKSWIVPPTVISILIVISLIAYSTVRAFG